MSRSHYSDNDNLQRIADALERIAYALEGDEDD